jgi:hypothetical protein
MISGGSALTPVSAVAASKVAENSQSPRATDFSSRRYYRHYRHYGYSPRYYRPRYYVQRRYYQPYYGSYGPSYGYPGYYGGYGYGGPGIGFSFGF